MTNSPPKSDLDIELAFTLLLDEFGSNELEQLISHTHLNDKDLWATEALRNWVNKQTLPASFVTAITLGKRDPFLSAVFNAAHPQQQGGVWSRESIAAFTLNGPTVWPSKETFLRQYEKSVWKLSWVSTPPVSAALPHRSEATRQLAAWGELIVYHWTAKNGLELWATRRPDAQIVTVQKVSRNRVVQRGTVLYPEGLLNEQYETTKILRWVNDRHNWQKVPA